MFPSWESSGGYWTDADWADRWWEVLPSGVVGLFLIVVLPLLILCALGCGKMCQKNLRRLQRKWFSCCFRPRRQRSSMEEGSAFDKGPTLPTITHSEVEMSVSGQAAHALASPDSRLKVAPAL